MEKFELEGSEFIFLCNLLKVTGLCETGGQAKGVISEGLVKVNNEIETRKRYKVRTGQLIEFSQVTVQVV